MGKLLKPAPLLFGLAGVGRPCAVLRRIGESTALVDGDLHPGAAALDVCRVPSGRRPSRVNRVCRCGIVWRALGP